MAELKVQVLTCLRMVHTPEEPFLYSAKKSVCVYTFFAR